MIPLGLGLRLPRFPMLTFLICVFLIFCFLVQKTIDQEQLVDLIELAEDGNKAPLVGFYQENNLLNIHNLSPFSFIRAQMTHGNIQHLVGNLFVFLIFGVYLEMRLGVLLFLLIYLLGGSIGIFMSTLFEISEDSYLLGASANISAVIGGFYIFFFKHPMRIFHIVILPFPSFRSYFFPISVAVPLFMVVYDLASFFATALSSHTTEVANLAHLAGFASGALMAYFIKEKNPLPYPFVSKDEVEILNSCRKEEDFEKRKEFCLRVLSLNPGNFKVRRYLLMIALQAYRLEKLPKKSLHNLFKIHLEPLLASYLWQKNSLRAYTILNHIPIEFPLFSYLPGLSQRQLLRLGDDAFDREDYLVALRLYHSFFHFYKGTENQEGLMQTCKNILESSQGKALDKNFLRSLLSSDEENLMFYRLAPYVLKES